MTQEELSQLLSVDQTTLSKIERGESKNPRKLGEIAEILGVPHPWLRFGIANIEKLEDKNVQAAFKLQSLTESDQESIRSMIERLSK